MKDLARLSSVLVTRVSVAVYTCFFLLISDPLVILAHLTFSSVFAICQTTLVPGSLLLASFDFRYFSSASLAVLLRLPRGVCIDISFCVFVLVLRLTLGTLQMRRRL